MSVKDGWSVITDRPDVAEACGSMIAAMLDRDAVMAEGVVIHEDGGALSVHSARSRQPRTLLDLPAACLTPVALATWAEADGVIVAMPTADCSPNHAELLAAHAHLYTVTAKMSWYRTRHPRGCLAAEEALVDAIRTLRPRFTPDPSVEGFLKSRVLIYRDQPHLIGIADLLNHHRRGAALRGNDHLTIAQAQPLDTDECFASYGSRGASALDRALAYGFADASSPVARSLPIDIPTAFGTVHVGSQPVRAKHVLDPPRVTVNDEGIGLSHLTFNRERPRDSLTVITMALTGVGFRNAGQVALEVLEAAAHGTLAALNDVIRLARQADRAGRLFAAVIAEGARLDTQVIRTVLAAVRESSVSDIYDVSRDT